MKEIWRFTEEQSHAFFVAFWENAKNPRLKRYSGIKSIAIWLETFRSGSRINVASDDGYREFFVALVEQELIRLALYEADDNLSSCGCKVFTHRRALQQFRLKN